MPVGDVEVPQEWSGALGSAALWVAVGVLLVLVVVSWWMASSSGSRRSGPRRRAPARHPRAEDAAHEDETVSRR